MHAVRAIIFIIFESGFDEQVAKLRFFRVFSFRQDPKSSIDGSDAPFLLNPITKTHHIHPWGLCATFILRKNVVLVPFDHLFGTNKNPTATSSVQEVPEIFHRRSIATISFSRRYTHIISTAQTEIKKHIIRAALKAGVASGALIQIKASYKLSPEAKKAMPKAKAAVTKADPKKKTTAPKKKATAPKKKATVAPKKKATSTKRAAVAPKKKVTAPKKASAPKKKATAPKKKATTALKKKATVAPKKKAVESKKAQ